MQRPKPCAGTCAQTPPTHLMLAMTNLRRACPDTGHPSPCLRHIMPTTGGYRAPFASASEKLGGRGACTHAKDSETHPSASSQTTVAGFPHTTSPHRRARPGSHIAKSASPLSSASLLNCSVGSCGNGLPLVPHVCIPAWPTFSVGVRPKASCSLLSISGIGTSGWILPPFRFFLLSAVTGPGASHLWCLVSTVLDKGFRTCAHTHPRQEAKASCWIFQFWGLPPGV